MPASVTGMGAIGTSLLLLAVMAPAVMTGVHRRVIAVLVICARPVVGLRRHRRIVRHDRRRKRHRG